MNGDAVLAPAAGPHTERFWRAAKDVVEKIENHAFLEQLLDGSLELEAFQFYIRQDKLYLGEFGKGLATLAGRSTHMGEAEPLIGFSKNTISVEAAMHSSWMEEWGDSYKYGNHGKARNCELYTSYLVKAATTDNFEVAVAAFCPCFWVYFHVGKYLRSVQKAPSPVKYYEQWIKMYAGEEFEKSVTDMLKLVEAAADRVGEEVRQKMEDAFVKACKMEWMFWQMGLEKDYWPL
eukprot:TRINITY_DN25099_c0_g1_i1.p1 TRINITY_DN25099_c0_g1~~TRINITY_DN25099_c0_g1_i1.p1  ORF type:complete len:234 (+),score=109.93 TRINITY_DN25099_c0_g1_i1:56-757(+)